MQLPMHGCTIPREQSLGYLSCKIHRLLSSDLARRFVEAGMEVTVEQWQVLMQLMHKDGATQNELTERLTQDKTGVSRLVKQLEKRGLVRRVAVPHDRRSRSVLILDAGRNVADRGLELAWETVNRAQANVAPEQLSICLDVLSRVLANLAPDGGCCCTEISK